VAGAGRVNVYFQQNTISLVPAIELGYRPAGSVVDFSIRIAPLIMLQQKGGLRYRYRNLSQLKFGPGGYNLRYIPLDTDGIEATYNGTHITTTPFRLSGFMVSLRIGLMFNTQ
ncbi:MAG: hypothetical protein M3R17_13660, partial [Bacteroidota bacterium]|nr:hypothetical protein [Bacteroidota bacterium]